MNNTNAGIIEFMKSLPEVYEQSPCPFWDDDYISEKMLAAHLDPDFDAASRKHDFIRKSVEWLSGYIGSNSGKKLLDLGCGPGIYAQQLAGRGFSVTGMDISRRSLDYAVKTAKESGADITYYRKNYLELDYENEFDAVILVYCDYGVLPPNDRAELLKKIRRALKDGGIVILDAWNMPYRNEFEETECVYYQNGGFWSAEENVVVQRSVFYADTANTLDRYMIITENDCKIHNIWNQLYSKDTLTDEFVGAGFNSLEFFDDIAGADFTGSSTTLCIAARK